VSRSPQEVVVMRVGIVLIDGTWPQIVDAARQADGASIDSVGFWDHYHSSYPGWEPHNGWAVYGYLAANTERIRLCPLVLDGPNYSIGRLAKETAMLSILSGERFDLGIGIGDVPEEEEAWGQPPYPDASVRIDWLEETIAALRLAWTGEKVDFTGEHIRLRGAHCPPAPPSPPPVVIGAASSMRIVRRAAAYADEINVYNNPAVIEGARQVIAASGRDIVLSSCADQFDDFGDQIPGTLEEQLAGWRDRGIDRLFISLYEPYALLPRLCEAIPAVQPST
jgi:alkanesulfonate monooxygenase SsuD/methylene tetrahydromethanopterin reductase-like flavin-dependent oxidoreductase (luciferase family)